MERLAQSDLLKDKERASGSLQLNPGLLCQPAVPERQPALPSQLCSTQSSNTKQRSSEYVKTLIKLLCIGRNTRISLLGL